MLTQAALPTRGATRSELRHEAQCRTLAAIRLVGWPAFRAIVAPEKIPVGCGFGSKLRTTVPKAFDPTRGIGGVLDHMTTCQLRTYISSLPGTPAPYPLPWISLGCVGPNTQSIYEDMFPNLYPLYEPWKISVGSLLAGVLNRDTSAGAGGFWASDEAKLFHIGPVSAGEVVLGGAPGTAQQAAYVRLVAPTGTGAPAAQRLLPDDGDAVLKNGNRSANTTTYITPTLTSRPAAECLTRIVESAAESIELIPELDAERLLGRQYLQFLAPDRQLAPRVGADNATSPWWCTRVEGLVLKDGYRVRTACPPFKGFPSGIVLGVSYFALGAKTAYLSGWPLGLGDTNYTYPGWAIVPNLGDLEDAWEYMGGKDYQEYYRELDDPDVEVPPWRQTAGSSPMGTGRTNTSYPPMPSSATPGERLRAAAPPGRLRGVVDGPTITI